MGQPRRTNEFARRDPVRTDLYTLDTRPSRAARAAVGLLILRATVGIVFLAHGAQKLLSFGIEGTQAAFAELGIPLATLAAPAVAGVEFLGGLALLVGLYTRLTAGSLGLVMLGAFFLVHLPHGFFLPNGVEFVLTLLAASVALIALGPGALSADAVLASRRERSAESEAPAWPPKRRRGSVTVCAVWGGR